MKFFIIASILSLLVLQGASQDLQELNNNGALYLAQQYCTHGEVLRCSDDCKGRKFCWYGNEVTIDCYSQTRRYCNRDTLECTLSSNSGDCEEVPEFLCPGVGTYPHALNCAKFWECGAKPPATILDCGTLVYDPVVRQCKAGISCYTFSPINGLCKGKNDSMVVHPLNKAIYAYCSGSFPQIGECPAGHIFNTLKLKCEFQCTIIGRFADPTDKACYFSCTKPSTTLIKERICCAAGNIFNPNYLACSPA